MTGEKREKPLWLDMPFGEALERFIRTDPGELPDHVKLRRPKGKAGAKKAPAGKGEPRGEGPGRRSRQRPKPG